MVVEPPGLACQRQGPRQAVAVLRVDAVEQALDPAVEGAGREAEQLLLARRPGDPTAGQVIIPDAQAGRLRCQFQALLGPLAVGDVPVGDHGAAGPSFEELCDSTDEPMPLRRGMAGILQLEASPAAGQHVADGGGEGHRRLATVARGQLAGLEIVGPLANAGDGPIRLGEPPPRSVDGEDGARLVQHGDVARQRVEDRAGDFPGGKCLQAALLASDGNVSSAAVLRSTGVTPFRPDPVPQQTLEPSTSRTRQAQESETTYARSLEERDVDLMTRLDAWIVDAIQNRISLACLTTFERPKVNRFR